jgi:hypothetical protein
MQHLQWRKLRLLLCVAWMAALVASLAGCGGGGQQAGSPETTTAQRQPSAVGRIVPAVPGLVVAEYDTFGNLLQQSTATDADGNFSFARALTGAWVQALVMADGRSVPDEWSARVTSPHMVALTPMTTLQWQLHRTGMAPSAAAAAVQAWMASACGEDAATVTALQLQPAAGLPRPDDGWLAAMGAYVRSLLDLGIQPDAGWLDLLQRRGALLGQMCQIVRALDSESWAKAVQAAGPSVNTLDTHLQQDYLSRVRQQARAGVLRLLGSTAPVLQHPELAPVYDSRISSWRGREYALSLELAQAVAPSVLAQLGAGQAVSDTRDADAARPVPGLGLGGVLQTTFSSTMPAAADDALSTRAWRVDNQADANRVARLAIDGVDVFGRAGMIREMLRLPRLSPDEPLHQRAWRFLFRWRKSAVPITGGLFQHQVDLYLRSIGAGRCDDDASALHELWTALGYESRIVGLGAHVVPEVRVDGRWTLYDPHYGLRWLRRDGEVAGADDLFRDPTLISDPVQPYAADKLQFIPEIVDAYVQSTGPVPLRFYEAAPTQPMDSRFTVPTGGHMDVVVGSSYSFPGLFWSTPGATVTTGQVRIWFPPGYAGAPVDLPLILADATGDGTVEALGTAFRHR